MVGRIIEFCATHRALVFIFTAFVVVGSAVAVRSVPLDAIPDLSDPQVIIFTEWMGRSPDLVEDQVTYPIVSSLLAAPRVEAVRGQSMFGMSFIYVIFQEGTDLYWARSRVLEYMNTIRSRLPQGVTPVLGPDATSVGWVFQYALVDRSGRHDLAELRAFQDFNLRYALASIPGVAEVASVGGYERQYQVEVDPAKLHAYDLSLADVSGAIRRSNSDVGGRVIEMSGREYFVRGRGYVKSLDDLRQVALGSDPRSGTPIRIEDVGTVSFGPDIRRGVAELNGEGEAVGGTVVMRYGENALNVIERVKKRIAELQATFPPGVEVEIVYDRSDLIHRAIETLRHTLLEEGIVVGLIIFVFLLHLKSTLVPVLSLPVAVGLAFVPMYFLRINTNIMSLGGIAIAIGAMVDAAIVLVENAHKHLESAPDPASPGARAVRQRILIDAAKEVGPPIFFSLLIITVAFLPIFALNGQAGRLFKPLAYTKTFSMAFAALVSITLAPALMALFIRGKIRHEKDHPVSRAMIRVYRPFAWVALKNPKTTIAIGLAAVLSAVPMAMRLGHEFMPPLNEGDLLYMPTTFPNISIEEAKRYLQVQDRIIRGFPEVERVFGKAGRSETPTDPAPLSMVETVVKLKPREAWRDVEVRRWYSARAPGWLAPAFRPLWPDRRRITWDELVAELNKAMQIPGWTNAWTMPIKTRIDMLSTGIRTPIGVKIFGASLDTIERIGMELERTVSRVPSTRSVYSDRSTGGFYLDIIPDRRALARYGLTLGEVQDVIEAAVGGQPIEVTVEGRNRFTINVRYPGELRQDVERLRHVLVPLRARSRGSGGSQGGMGGGMGALPEALPPQYVSAGMADVDGVLAQAMSGDSRSGKGGASPMGGPAGGMTGGMTGTPGGMGAGEGNVLPPGAAAPGAPALEPEGGGAHVPLGQVADIQVVTGPPMIRDEAGMLVGYVYVDMDAAQRDIGSYVDEAKQLVAKEVRIPAGYSLKWTGQYELLQQMQARMKFLVPLTLVIVLLLLYMNFGNIVESLIVLCSVPFALVGSVWLMALLGYNLSTAVWVGIIALVGLAAQTGVVMVVYCDSAYHKRKREGRIRDLDDIVEATLEGSVQRVRPKLMTVATMMIGLVPLLWSQGSGADVMKRVAAPMVGGLFTSAFLTLEIIPVVYTYWRYAQLRREQRARTNP